MKKIGIVTIDSWNYGNKLQNYALQEAIRQLGHDCETLKRVKLSNVEAIKKGIKIICWYLLNTKGKKFNSFSKKIKWSKHYVSQHYISDNVQSYYDFFITGSDQVWNPNYDFVGDNEFLTFVPIHKRIAYAASFGVAEIPLSKRDKYINNLEQMKGISVREEAGANIIYRYINKKVSVVLDPTMLIAKEQWRNLSRKPKVKKAISKLTGEEINITFKKKYILLYFLGEVKDINDNLLSTLNKYGEYEVINMFDLKRNGKPLAIGPLEFLWLIDNASIFITDSFHGCVFSIIFNTPFIAIERVAREDGDMNSRFDTLLKTFGLETNRFSNVEFSVDSIMNMDFEQANSILEKEKVKSWKYLTDMLKS